VSERPSIVATASALLGALALAGITLGPLLANLGLVQPMVGFTIFLAGALDALGALVIGIAGLVLTRQGARPGRGRVWFGLLAGALVVVVVGSAGARGRGLPRINDITTDPDDPPTFESARVEVGHAMEYPAGFGALQRKAYPDLRPIPVAAPPEQAFERCTRAARALGWEITLAEPERGRLEARDVSGLFHFVDDVAVRVSPAPGGGSVVDVRSKSRNGQGDLGVNAARIRALQREIQTGAS
jgi:uncharacterized protein (DUF1499 family)